MSAIKPLYQLFGINFCKLSRGEVLILEAEVFVQLYRGLNEIFRSYYKNYFRLMKFTQEMENAMLESNFIRNLIRDVLSTREYSLEGVAYYTNIPEDVIQEMAAGNNANPSLHFSRKIIELHREIRLDLYQEIVKKNIIESLNN